MAKELLELIVKSLVDYPEEVVINQVENENSITLELAVSRDDMGKIIGRQGRTAKAIRAVMKAAALKANKRISLEIV